MLFKYTKRFLDITLSFSLLVIFSWLFLLIFLLYFVTFSFPVIFRQKRIGKDGIPFTLYKFRTLKQNQLPLAERRFPLGNLLRYFSFDELPQLLNVLRGEMSLIGPRPLPTEYRPFFSVEQDRRHKVKPGITGWAQVNGRHGISWERKFEYDLYYVENQSLWLDMLIFFKTIYLLLSFKKDASLEEQKFTGNA